jgi:hypothetical protein
MSKPKYCLFCYASQQARKAGEMEYTVDAGCLDEVAMIVEAELAEGMYCVSVYERQPFAAPMQFVEAHIQPLVAAA